MDSDTAYCRAQVEAYDRDRYILSMNAPATARASLWALYAFNHELAKTREITREPNAGHIRLAWWREKLDGFYAGEAMPAHDVARALGRAIHAHDLPQDAFTTLIDARGFDLDGHVPASLEGLTDYVRATNVPLTTLSARVLDCQPPGDLGVAWGLIGVIRSLPFLARQNRCLLPLPMLHDIGLMPEQFHHLAPSPALSNAVAAIAAVARMHMGRAQGQDRVFAAQIRMCALYLRRIEKAGYDPFDPRVWQAVPFLALRVLF